MNSSSLTFFNLPEEKKYKSEFNNDTYIGWMPPTEKYVYVLYVCVCVHMCVRVCADIKPNN